MSASENEHIDRVTYHVKRRVILLRSIETTGKLGHNGPLAGRVLNKRGDGRLKVSRVGEPIRPNGPELGKRKVSLVQLRRVTSDWAVRKRDTIANPTRNDTNLIGANQQAAQLGLNVEDAVLEDNQQVAIGGVECLSAHVFASSEDEDAEACMLLISHGDARN